MRALLVLLAGCASPLGMGGADLFMEPDAAPDLAQPDLRPPPGSCATVDDCAPPAHGSATCTAGRCVAQCDAGFGDCDGEFATGCEADLAADPAHCGTCGRACASGRCGSFIATSFAQPPADWAWNGAAHHDALSLSAVLTDASNAIAGTATYVNPVVIDEFDATFSFQIGGGTGADGMAFAVSQGGPNGLGGAGGALGVVGLGGWGVEFDTYNNNICGDADANHVAIDDLAPCGPGVPTPVQVAPAPFAMRNTGAHAARVTLKNGAVTVALDGQTVLDAVALPNFAPGQPRWFTFGAGTGGANDRHEVRNLAIQFPSPRCL